MKSNVFAKKLGFELEAPWKTWIDGVNWNTSAIENRRTDPQFHPIDTTNGFRFQVPGEPEEDSVGGLVVLSVDSERRLLDRNKTLSYEDRLRDLLKTAWGAFHAKVDDDGDLANLNLVYGEPVAFRTGGFFHRNHTDPETETKFSPDSLVIDVFGTSFWGLCGLSVEVLRLLNCRAAVLHSMTGRLVPVILRQMM